jgi:hypothetical protein
VHLSPADMDQLKVWQLYAAYKLIRDATKER